MQCPVMGSSVCDQVCAVSRRCFCADRCQLPMQVNVEDTARLASKHTDLPAHVLKELATKSETVTPWWWGLKTLIKVRTP